ncbi:zinc finger CCCH domain-containing protein 4 isoform X3 [Frankliniella occidentalis]|uniref:Zinc finger CCCH domain-containing protein 4 isoform X3 n=1 Tax=Frankliniella occidentalis TaxID=133901 RepID=A0A9C6UFI1_FRAOC|nr:zinc finger CCCH domain-containing protein 4 isoform X3 [Frankliniella occidentalis]
MLQPVQSWTRIIRLLITADALETPRPEMHRTCELKNPNSDATTLNRIESKNNVDLDDLEDGEIDDDDDDNTVLAVSSAPAPTPSLPPSTGPSAPRIPPLQKSPDVGRREHHEGSTLPHYLQRRLGPTPPKKKNKGSWGPPKNNFPQEEEEDDFAVHLEKILLAKAKEKAKQAKLEQGGEVEEVDEPKSEEEDNHGKKKRKRKKSRDGDGDRSKRKRREGDEDEDDMIFVRGASPHNEPQEPPSPSFRDYDLDRSYESYGEEEEDYDGSPERSGHGGFSSRGRGRGNKSMRGSGRGRGRMGTPNEGGRGGFMNKRGSKRGNARGGASNKSQQRSGRDRSQDVCTYFMQGKCPKDADECLYSHDALPKRKMELCKFYNMNCCAKREKCLYMHKDFPCKYFHTGRKCNSGDKCRYSHDPLSDGTRSVLLKHIELAPKEILGEFRRLTREQANQLIDKAAKMRAEGKNPEGVDLLKDENEDEAGDERAHTPMPSSPGEVVQQESESRRSRGEDSRRRDYYDRSYDRDKNRDRNHSDRRDQSERKERRERRRKRRWDSPDNSPSQLKKLQENLQRQLREQEDNEREDKMFSKADTSDDLVIDEDEGDTPKISKSSKNPQEGDNHQSDINSKDSRDSGFTQVKDETLSEKLNAEVSTAESADDSQETPGTIPAHLPKRQRELFLRIQQQQREAEHNRESKDEESEEDAALAEDDWYSSDDEGPTSLTDVLKNLKDGQKEDGKSGNKQEVNKSAKESKEPNLSAFDNPNSDQSKGNVGQSTRRPPLLPTPSTLTDLVKNTAIDQLLSTIRYGPTGSGQADNTSTPVGLKSPPTLSASSTSTAPFRDPRLSRDPRSRISATASSVSPSASPSQQPDVRPDPRLDQRAEPRADSWSDPWSDSRSDPRPDPRAERRDPRMDSRLDASHAAMDSLASPRSEQRGDPRASRRSFEGVSTSLGNNPSLLPHSIYDGPNPPIFSGTADVDLRVRSVAAETISDTDFRRQSAQFGSGDMDMRRDRSSNILSAHIFSAQDTDLRFRQGNPSRDSDSDYAAASQSDLDLRRMQMMLPFKPAPVHTPATEINASLASYTPGAYRVVEIDIPKPDLSSLKVNPRDQQVKLDPRLQRWFGMVQPDNATSSTPSSPPIESSLQTSVPLTPLAARSDPRRRNSNSSLPTRPADPRQSRMGIGTASGLCPPTPRVDDFDDHPVADTDLRMQAQFGRQQGQWDNTNNRRGLLPHPDSSWMPNPAASFGRATHMQPHSYHQQRSYTPPPT